MICAFKIRYNEEKIVDGVIYKTICETNVNAENYEIIDGIACFYNFDSVRGERIKKYHVSVSNIITIEMI